MQADLPVLLFRIGISGKIALYLNVGHWWPVRFTRKENRRLSKTCRGGI